MFTLKLCSALGGSVKGDLSRLRERETVWDYCKDNEGSSHFITEGHEVSKVGNIKTFRKGQLIVKGGHI